MAKKKEPSDKHYLAVFSISMIIALAIHLFLLSKITLHPTLHVLISFIIFWVVMGVISIISENK